MNIQQKRMLMDMRTILQIVLDEGNQAALSDQNLKFFTELLNEVENGARRLKEDFAHNRRAWVGLTESAQASAELEGRGERMPQTP